MALDTKTYSIANDTLNGAYAGDSLTSEIQASAIVTALDSINTEDDDLNIVFKDTLSGGDTTILDGIVAAHDGTIIAEATTPKDVDGVPLSRTKITKTGWHFQAQSVEFTTSTLNSVYNKDVNGDDLGYTTIKFFDENDDELVAGTQIELDTDCIRTEITWEPTSDFEVIGGTLYQSVAPTEDCRIWIIAVPDVPVIYGGSIPFAEGGLNLRRMGIGDIMDLDGKTPKLMKYDATYHTNKFKIILRHGVGHASSLMIVFKIFEA